MSKKALVIPDCHVPYHHKRAFEIVLEMAKDTKDLQELVILGDFADFYAVNAHGKHPHLLHTLMKEIEEVNACLDVIDAEFPGIQKVFLEGNHEYRLERYIHQNASALFGITQWDMLFKLDKRPKWKAVDYGFMQYHKVLGSDLYARHEPYSMSSAKASLSASACNLVYGHVHRIDEAITRRPDNSRVVNFTPGWLGDNRKKDVFGYVKRPPNWQMGCAFVEVEGREFEYEIVKLNERARCRYNGKSYR